MINNTRYARLIAMFIERTSENLKKSRKIIRTGAGALCILGSALIPHPVMADEGVRVVLTPPEGSVTSQASGWADLQVISYRKDIDLAEVLVNGHLDGLVPERVYRFWLCWRSEADCATFAYPEIVTDQNGASDIKDLNITVFNRPKLPVASVKVTDVTYGSVPADSCFLPTSPCLRASYSVKVP